MPNMADCSSGDVIDKIEAVMEQMVDALLNDKTEISITVKTRRATSTTKSSKHANGGPRDATAPSRTLRFPGKSEDEAWRFGINEAEHRLINTL